MITSQSQHPDFKPKKSRLLSDWALINGCMHSTIFALLIGKPSRAIVKLCLQFIQSNNSLIAYGWTSITRKDHGSMSGGGVVQMLGVCGLCLAYNSTLVWKIFSPLVGWFVVPLLPFIQTPDELYDLTFVQNESKALVVYLVIFILFSWVHIIKNWFGYAPKSTTSRGVGYLYLLLDRLFGKHTHINEFAVYFLECIVLGVVGILLLIGNTDPYLGGWLLSMCLAELRILLYEKSAQIQTRRLLDA
ncbi:hypothetical protein [Reichenbachiella sp.]|uniref:hypothetical protein n=1 Tax=Reichenbachiella sp. TaxID=2184521 RepID=UPI0032985D7E